MSMVSRIRELMNQKGVKPSELSRRSKISKGHISAILNGKKTNVELETIRRIAYSLGVTLKDIVCDDTNLLEFGQTAGLSFEEYISLLENTADIINKPTTQSGWEEFYKWQKTFQ